ncbi:L-threonylcarbamoyladenylate synthase [Rubrivivax sp. RP6-9]|uniref:L-threonylcarbamoyladenylate synthase n=1 Tax=Rubrivivax sp. RP6-9 TaxID=3415750 RepID=UPI003CC6B45B
MPVTDGNDPAALAAAADALAAGALVAFPTETVYGLGARADDDAAVAGIFAAKGRPSDHPLIVHVADAAAIDVFALPPGPAARALMAAFWPGPLTLILPRRPGAGAAAAGGQDSIGLRVPSHPLAQALLRACAARGVAGVAAPSANRFGRVSPTTAAHVADEFGDGLLVLDGGPCEVGIESAIVDCTRATPALLRPGGLDRTQLEAAIGQPLAAPDAASPRASGTLEAHYAPRAKVVLFDGPALRAALAGPVPQGVAVYSALLPPASAGVVHRAMPRRAAAAAHELFAVLRAFDAAGASQIWVERPPPGPAWDGVRDRLQRAAAA